MIHLLRVDALELIIGWALSHLSTKRCFLGVLPHTRSQIRIVIRWKIQLNSINILVDKNWCTLYSIEKDPEKRT